MSPVSRVLAPVLAAALMVGPVAAQKPIARYEAQAVNLDLPANGPVQILITRWSTDAERDRLMDTLLEKGSSKLLDILSKMPAVGSIRTPDSVGYNLKYARLSPMAGGAEQVVIITDRPVGFAERREGGKTTEYPFTVIEMHMNSNGVGEGQISLATKINADKASRSIALENYGIGGVLLKNVRKMKS